MWYRWWANLQINIIGTDTSQLRTSDWLAESAGLGIIKPVLAITSEQNPTLNSRVEQVGIKKETDNYEDLEVRTLADRQLWKILEGNIALACSFLQDATSTKLQCSEYDN